MPTVRALGAHTLYCDLHAQMPFWPAPMTTRPMLVHEHGLLFAFMFAACLAGIATRPVAFMASFWPANGLLLGLMLRNPTWSKTPLAWLSAWLGFIAADALTGASLERNLVINTINLVAVLVGWLFLVRQGPATLGFRRQRSVLIILVGCVLAAITGALLSSLNRDLFFSTTGWQTFAIWGSGELYNLVLCLPVVLAAPRGWIWQWRGSRVLQPLGRFRGLPLLALIASEAAAFALQGPGALVFAVPALVWCAMTYGVFLVSVLNLLVGLWSTAALVLLGLSLTPEQLLDTISFRVGVALLSLAPLAVATAHALHAQALQILHRAVNHDFLTGALSRRALMERGAQQLQRLQRENTPVAVLMFDMDYFKQVNDRWGHAQGDIVLQQFAQLIQRNLRPGELFGRIGGEEFALLLTHATHAAAQAVSERLCAQLREHRFTTDGGESFGVTMSVGLHAGTPADTPYAKNELLARADAALYHAKTSGRNQVQSFDPTAMTPLRHGEIRA